jgi:hypothetical protein
VWEIFPAPSPKPRWHKRRRHIRRSSAPPHPAPFPRCRRRSPSGEAQGVVATTGFPTVAVPYLSRCDGARSRRFSGGVVPWFLDDSTWSWECPIFRCCPSRDANQHVSCLGHLGLTARKFGFVIYIAMVLEAWKLTWILENVTSVVDVKWAMSSVPTTKSLPS